MKEKTWKNCSEFLENMNWLTLGMWLVDDSSFKWFKWWALVWISQGVWFFLKRRIVEVDP